MLLRVEWGYKYKDTKYGKLRRYIKENNTR